MVFPKRGVAETSVDSLPGDFADELFLPAVYGNSTSAASRIRRAFASPGNFWTRGIEVRDANILQGYTNLAV